MADSTSPVQWLATDTLKKTAHYKYDIYIYLIEEKKTTHYMGYLNTPYESFPTSRYPVLSSLEKLLSC